MIHDPLTKLQCSPTSDGSACAIVASERYVDEHGLWDQAIEIAGQSMVTDLSSTFADDTDCIKIVGSDMSKEAARPGLRGGRGRGRRGRRLRAARLLQRQRADHLRGARLRRRGRGPQAGRGRGDHLRRRRPGRQPLRRPDLQGPPARRDRPRAVLRADLAAARRGRQAPGRGRQGRAPAQHRPRRRRRGHRLQARGGLEHEPTATATTSAASPTSSATSREAIRDFAQRECGTPEQRERLTNGYTELHNQELYEKLAELGWLGVAIAEEYGGSGGGMVDVCIFLEEIVARPDPDRRVRRQPDRRRRLRALRHRGAEAGDPRRDHQRARRGDRDVRARGGLRRRQPLLQGRAPERRLRPQRPEDLDLGRPHRRPHPARRPHRRRPAPSTRG